MKAAPITFRFADFTQSPVPTALKANASEMEHRHLQRLDNGVGFIIQVAPKTRVSFSLVETRLSPAEDGILAWEFLPTAESARQCPQFAAHRITVFNS
jgi:hypothetical protein